jgi:phosphoribosylamine--glycine ligase
VLAAPGNAGILRDAAPLAGAPAPEDAEAFAAAAKAAGIDFAIIGPEGPLVGGLADAMAAAGIPAFGPSAATARLEGSKVYAKDIMAAASVPTGAHRTVTTVEEGLAAVEGYPAVIKFDGLAAGKGVAIPTSEAEAREALVAMLDERRFGDVVYVRHRILS